MKKLLFLLLVPALMRPVPSAAQTQGTTAPAFGISFSGFVKTDYFFDTREGVSIREGHFLLYPKEPNLDENGVDINAKSSFNFLSIQSRLTGKITAPDAFGAKVTGVLEADFFGNENASFVDANGFRLRHAYAKLNWEKTELIAGQYWHPFFIPACFSGVVSFNTGAPFQPFSRNPQLRLTYRPGKISFTGVASAQRDFTSPVGTSALRYSTVPDITGLIAYESRNAEAKTEFVAGAAVDYKTLQPLLTTSRAGQTFVTDEKVSGLSATAFIKIGRPDFVYKIQAVYGQNLFDLIMLGGYVVSELADVNTNRVTYSTLNNLSMWTEFQTLGPKVQFGLWGGYSRNLGSKQEILSYSNTVGGNAVTTRGANMKSLMRVSPRIVFIQGKFNFATELEYTSAAYATFQGDGTMNRDEFGVITDSENVGNMRILLSAILNF
ncbi:MAG: hypothetical protein IH591_05555 [Bacteroidales bacterium]|nr:hypothetical protein [Bacteroidales bacterium]